MDHGSRDDDEDKRSAASNTAAQKKVAANESMSSSSPSSSAEKDTQKNQTNDESNNTTFVAGNAATQDADVTNSVDDNPKVVRLGDDLPKKTHQVSSSSSSSSLDDDDDDDDDVIQLIIKQRLTSYGPNIGAPATNTDEEHAAQQESIATSAPEQGILPEKLAPTHHGGCGRESPTRTRRESIVTEEIKTDDTERFEPTCLDHIDSVTPSVVPSPEQQHPQDNIQQTAITNEPTEILVEATPVVSRRRKHDDEAVVVPNVLVVEARAENSRRSWAMVFIATLAVATAVILGILIPRRKDNDEKPLQTILPTFSPTMSSQPSELPSLAPSLSIMPSFSPTTVPSLSPSFGPRPLIPSGADLRSAIQTCTLHMQCLAHM